jgi:hypothetical protein
MTMISQTFTDRQALAIRLIVGVVIGLIIATLDDINKPWGDRAAFGFALIAPVVWAGVGTMRRKSLVIWTLLAATLIAAILWFESITSTAPRFDFDGHYLLLLPLLFIAHELVSSGDIAGKWIAPYETYFEEAWKRGVQLALSILFTLLFWGILHLGAALLGFIGFSWFKTLLEQEHFSIPVTGLAFGAAVHLGDVQTKLLSNVRALILGVLSWLLPVITLIGGIFAVSLMVSGLAPLWATKAATATLLGGCVGFVLLINAAYQQGDAERQVSVVLKWSARGAALLLLVFSVLAAWSLSLRIGQYGLSGERVLAGLGVITALAYGLCYSATLFVPGRWMMAIERINIALAIFKCVLFVAILTPIAAPNRLSVNDQVARLTSSKVSVDKFDWWLLRDETGSYGKAALAKLATSTNPAIAAKAKAALDGTLGERPYRTETGPNQVSMTRADIEALPVVYPKGGKLPASFLAIDFSQTNDRGEMWTNCLRYRSTDPTETPNCRIALFDLNRDGREEILIREYSELMIYTLAADTWRYVGAVHIGNALSEFDSGQLRTTPSRWDDLVIGDQRRSVGSSAEDLFATEAAVAAAKAAADAAAKSEAPQPKAPSPPSK